MGHFKKKKKETPAISTASLPDIVFILLFFFMVATRMRETEIKVKQSLPQATEMENLEKKDLLSYIYIGQPSQEFQEVYGQAPRLQLNDRIGSPEDVYAFIELEKQQMPVQNRNKMIVCLKVDKNADLGVVTDVKTELRKSNALKVVYITNKGRTKNR
jgi:biopolymer transport protein ExbD